MARGWESKDVESQQELRDQERRLKAAALQLAATERDRVLKLDSLQLTRVRVVADLERARHPRHQDQIRAALAHIDSEIEKLS